MKRAYTLVELLVVIAIIGILVAILLPAVQAAREAARRTECSNNLKQIGVALHAYHALWNAFPCGAKYPTPAATGKPQYGWGYTILPQLEQKNLYDQLGRGEALVMPPPTLDGTGMPLKSFRCPSSTGPPQNPEREGYGAAEYVCMVQTSSGLFPNAFDGWRRISDVTDGTSTTIAVGERRYRDGYAGIWAGRGNLIRMGAPISSGAFDNAGQIFGRKPLNNGDKWYPDRQFSSEHPTGVLFLFVDNSVRFVGEDTIGIGGPLEAMATIAGGEVVVP